MAVEGVEQTRRNLRRVSRAVIDAMNDALEDGAGVFLSQARDFAPQLTGQLIRDSGVSSVRRGRNVEGRRIKTFSIFFGNGPSRAYAVLQHERRFNPGPITRSKPGAGRKYLSRAFDKQKRKVIRQIGRDVERAILATRL